MNCLVPDYYPDFQCSGSSCQDNCCIGWEIGIDADTLAYYQALDGTIGETLAQNITGENPPHFILDNAKRCPFLNPQNLCQLHIQLGEAHLCSICAQHPRFHNWFGSWKESGLGLCCEQAARLILFSQGNGFIQLTTPEPPDPDSAVDPQLLQGLQAVRQTVFSILQYDGISLLHRLCLVTALAQDLQGWLEQSQQPELTQGLTPAAFCANACQGLAEFYGDDACYTDFIGQLTAAVPNVNQQDILPQILQFHRQLSANDPAWHTRLEQLKRQLPSLGQIDHVSQLALPLQRIAIYFVYRYFLSSALQGNALGGLLSGVVGTLMIGLLQLDTLRSTGTLTASQQIGNAKAYSKEVEYSPENQEQLNNAIWTEDFFAPSRLMGCLLKNGGI